jgi:hypothetical protein
MDVNLLVSLVSTIIMLIFGAIVLQRYARRRHRHNLFWGVGLVMFGIATFSEGYLLLQWNALAFLSWYVLGAMLNAGWLGHGTLSLLSRRRWVSYVTVVLVILSLIGLVVTFTLPLDATAYSVGVPISEQYAAILPAGAAVRMLTPIFNIYGTIFLVGGAFYSAYLFWRKRVLQHRVIGNVLIAVGALVVASAGTLARLAFGGFMPVSELIAAVLMFAGFIVATSPAAVPAAATKEAPRPA